MCSAVCQSVALHNGQARRTPWLMLQYICSVQPCAYMLHGACLRENKLQTLSGMAVVGSLFQRGKRRCCLRLKSADAEASSWHVTHHTLQLSQAYLHASVTCDELSACTTDGSPCQPALVLTCTPTVAPCSLPTAAPSAWQPCHTHGSVFIMRPYTTLTTSVILTFPSTVPSGTHSRRGAHRICFGGMPGGASAA
jgi:hypothetical protein